VAAYNADIRIGVVGKAELNNLQKQLDKAYGTVNKINKAMVFKGRTQTIKLNTKGAAAQLRQLENQLNKLGRVTVRVRTSEEKGKGKSGNSTVITNNSNQGPGVALAALNRQVSVKREMTAVTKAETASLRVNAQIRSEIEKIDEKILKNREEQARLNKTLPGTRGQRKLTNKEKVEQLAAGGQLNKKQLKELEGLRGKAATLGPAKTNKKYRRFYKDVEDMNEKMVNGHKRLAGMQAKAENATREHVGAKIREEQKLLARRTQLQNRGNAAEIAGANKVTEAHKQELRERQAAFDEFHRKKMYRNNQILKRDALRAKKARGQNFQKGAIGAGGVAASSALSAIPGLSGASTGATVGFFTGGVPGAIGGALAGGAVEGVAALAALGKEAAVTRAEFDKLQISLELAAGDDFGKSVKAIQKVVDDFNAPLVDTTEQFTKLYASAQGSGITFKELETLFVGLSAANKAYAGDAEDLNGILRAFTQIISKGTVQSEELKGQVGERLPGAFKKAADSLGLTTAQLQKALEDGDVNSADFVKKFGKYMLQYEDDAKTIAKSPAEAGARLKTAIDKLLVSLGPVFASMGSAFQDFATSAINSLIPLAKFLNTMFAKISEAPIAIAKAQRDSALRKYRESDSTRWNHEGRKKNLDRAVSNLNTKLAERDALEAALERRAKRMTENDVTTVLDEEDKTKGGAGGPKPAKPQDTVAETRLQIDHQRTLLGIEREKFDLIGQESSLQQITLQREAAKSQLNVDLLKIQQQNLTAQSKVEQTVLRQLQHQTEMQGLANQEQQLIVDRTKAFEEQVEGLERAFALESATTEEKRRQVELEHALADVKNDDALSDDQKATLNRLLNDRKELADRNADPIFQYMNQLEQSINDTRGQIASLAQTIESELATAMSSAVTGLIDGTSTVEEAMSSMLKNIGQAFIDMATRILAQKAIFAILSAFGGGGGGGGFNNPNDFNSIIQLPKYALGGPVTAKKPYIVGETGPELFIPSEAGRIGTNGMFDAATGALGSGNATTSSEGGDDGFAESAFSAAAGALISTTNNRESSRVVEMQMAQVAAIENPEPIDVRFQSTVINNTSYVSVEEFQTGLAQTANRARSMTLKDLRQKPATRRSTGVA